MLLSAVALFLLSFVSSWYFNSQLSVGYQKKKLQKYVTERQKDAQQLVSDTSLLRRLVLRRYTDADFQRLMNKPYGFFLFAETLASRQEPLFWNSQKIVPPSVDFNDQNQVSFAALTNGLYIINKTRVSFAGMTNKVVVYTLIPVFYKYPVETQVTQPHFAHDVLAIKWIAISPGPTEFPVVSLDGEPLFYLRRAPANAGNSSDPLTAVLRLAAVVLLIIAVHLFARHLVHKQGARRGIVFFATSLLAIRGLMLTFYSLFAVRQFELFDPTIFAEERFVNRSLGDLLLNAIVLCWIVLFTWTYLGPLKKLPRRLQDPWKPVAGVVVTFLLLLVTFQLARLVNNLVVNSTINFDVADVSNLFPFTGFKFLILALLSLSYYYFSRLLFRIIVLLFPNLISVYLSIAVTGLVLLSLQKDYQSVLFRLPVLLWLVLYGFLLTQGPWIFNRFRVTVAGVLFWIFLFSLSLTALIQQGKLEKEKRDWLAIATNYELVRDPTRLQTIDLGLNMVNSAFLTANFQRFAHPDQHVLLKDSILSSSLAGYADNYKTKFYLFDSSKNPVYNPDQRTYDELEHMFSNLAKPTERPGVFIYEPTPAQIFFLIKRQALDSSRLLATLFLVISPRQLDENIRSLDADIFKRRDEEPPQAQVFALYKDDRLINFWGTYPFLVKLNRSAIGSRTFTELESNDYRELWCRLSNNRYLLIAEKKEALIDRISLFSYLFCAFLFMVAVIRSFDLAGKIAKSWPRIDVFSRLSIRSQIHVTIIVVTLFSFVVIGYVTISYFKQRFRRNNVEELISTSASTINELQKGLSEDSLRLTVGTFYNVSTAGSIEKLVNDISEVHKVIVNIYDTTGALQLTSDKQIYTNGVLNRHMDPAAFRHLYSLGEMQRVQQEALGNTRYQSIYTAILDDTTRDRLAFLNIPAAYGQRELDQEISTFVVTIVNLIAFIVLIAGGIALFIANRITLSFAIISNKMKEVTLGKTNEEIEWNRSDEIGELVSQYNKMVRQLEQSATALAKSEREGAWREMARQVAHEIKNPLTPMKLSIQYLQRAIQNNQPNVKDLTTNVAGTLIEQIDHLSKIAADFSQFANISNKRVEQFDLHSVIGSLLDLYAANPKVTLTWNPIRQDALMKADKTQMNRLFTNLLTNAVDACSEKKTCQVTITERVVGSNIQIAIADNGDGIPDDLQSKIFTPNFTTKTSGTGLGLAMCKGIVEQAGGAIWFETKEGEGTTFFVQLPLGVRS